MSAIKSLILFKIKLTQMVLTKFIIKYWYTVSFHQHITAYYKIFFVILNNALKIFLLSLYILIVIKASVRSRYSIHLFKMKEITLLAITFLNYADTNIELKQKKIVFLILATLKILKVNELPNKELL